MNSNEFIPCSARRSARWLGVISLFSLLAGPTAPSTVRASDHIDAPVTQGTAAVDIGDFYAWHTERGTLVTIITFEPLLEAGADGSYDPEVLYTIHIDNTADPAEANQPDDNDNDNEADIQIHVRFGQNDLGEWGVQFLDVPGADGPMVGPVQNPITSGSAQAMAGVFDDPFFFDFEGFTATIGNLMDDTEAADIEFASIQAGAPVDFFAGLNTLAIIVEFDIGLALDGNADNFLQLWATTGRLP